MIAQTQAGGACGALTSPIHAVQNSFSSGERAITKTRHRSTGVVEPSTARGRAARQRIMAAAEIVLNRVPYGQARIADVTKEAGTAFGLFYRYFPDFRSLAADMIESMLHRFDPVLELSPANDPAALLLRIRTYHRITVDNHADHPGLIRASPEVGMENADFRKRVRSLHMRYLEHIVGESIPAWEADAPDMAKAQRRMRILALGGMSTGVLLDYYVWKTSSLRKCRFEREEIADWLSISFHRMLTGHDPDLSGFTTLDRIAPLISSS